MYLVLLCFLRSKKQRQCRNGFDAYILLVLNIFLWKMYAKMHLMLPLHFVGAEHFPLENVRVAKMHLMPKCILAYIFQRKMFSCAKMHLMPKCIFAYILRSKMFSITFSFGKCSASHFPKENVQQRTAEHFPKENVQQSKM